MMMGDLQIISGLAILISGYAVLNRPVSAYHWRIICRLAWFSTVTHLAVLTCLRKYFYHNQMKRTIRLILMGILTIMLLVAVLPTFPTAGPGDQPALCYYRSDARHIFNPEVILSSILLLFGASIRGLKLHKRTSHFLQHGVRRPFFEWTSGLLRKAASVTCIGKWPLGCRLLYHMCLLQPAVAAVLMLDFYLNLYSSVAAEASLSSMSWDSHLYH